MNEVRRIRLVCGCGYLGSRVAARWLAAGDRVLGVTRGRPALLTDAGIEPVVADLGSDQALPPLPPVDTVFWAVGFGRIGDTGHSNPRNVHVLGLSRLLDHLAAEAHGTPPTFILSSSTGVWGERDGGIVDETTPAHPDRDNGRVLLEAEAVLRNHRLGPGVALRFAGLYGPGRLPRLDDLRAGRPIPVDPDSWLNLIHVDDASRVVEAVAEHPSPATLYVVSDGRPILRRDWYDALAARIGSPAPTWSPPDKAPVPHGGINRRGRGSDKRVDARRIWSDLGIEPIHPDATASLASIPFD